jgi:hypothetical protein
MSTTFDAFPALTSNLGHSLNSRGELGMFVNPYACSCTTCESVVQKWEPPPSIQSELDAAEALLSLSGIHLAPSPPTALARTITGFHYAPSDTATLPASPTVPEEIVLEPEQAKTIAENLQEYIEILRERQDKVYDETARSHDEMAAQDMEFEEIDRKIAELDEILAVLNTSE